VLRGLRGSVGGWGLRGLLSQALVMLLYGRLGRICGQMERLSLRFQAGRLWRVATRAGGEKNAAEFRKPVVVLLRWPGRFGWLVQAAAYQAAGYGCQLREILGQPEMVELLLAAPQAARILRPVCRMLAVETSLLRPRAAGAAVEPEAQAPGEIAASEVTGEIRKRVRRARVPVDWGRIPLPRGVLAAARRRGFGKDG